MCNSPRTSFSLEHEGHDRDKHQYLCTPYSVPVHLASALSKQSLASRFDLTRLWGTNTKTDGADVSIGRLAMPDAA